VTCLTRDPEATKSPLASHDNWARGERPRHGSAAEERWSTAAARWKLSLLPHGRFL